MKLDVLYEFPDAYCVKLIDGSGYLVWPSRTIGQTGFERPAIGFGKTAKQAWASVKIRTESTTNHACKAYRIKSGQQSNGYDILVGPNGFRCELTEPEDRTWSRDASAVVEELNRLHELLEKQKLFHRDSVAEVEPEQAISCEGREENGK